MSSQFLKHNSDMLDAARHCIAQRQFLPALVLMYSHIDVLAWAGSAKQKQAVRLRFEAWVSRWLLPELSINAPNINATDLYAARCGILHTLTSKSDLSATGAAREIAYAWGIAQAPVLDAVIAQTEFTGRLVTLHYETLLNALEISIQKFLAAASSDPELESRLEDAAGRHFSNISVRRDRQ